MTTQKTNLNVSPYYDDFDETKNYTRILFNPGVAVQSRELTQIQSILQNQISNFGLNIFKEGSLVYGSGLSINQTASSLKFESGYSDDMTDLVGVTVVGNTSGATGKILTTSAEVSVDEPATIYLNTLTGTDFQDGETISNQETAVDIATLASTDAVNGCVLASSPQSIYFVHGHFVLSNASTEVVSKYTASPDILIGFNIVEDIITSVDDETLQDPANGSYNYLAPGADRLKISLDLTSIGLEDDTTDFVQMVRMEDGTITQEITVPIYGVIEETLARRTYDESGSYTVKPYTLSVTQNADSDEQVNINIGAGKSFVRGHEYQTISTTRLTADKPRTYDQINNASVYANYGNFIYVENVSGAFNFSEFEQVSLHSVVSASVDPSSQTNWENTLVATANIRNFVHDNNGTYRAYLFNIKYVGSGSINDVLSVVTGGYDTGTVDSSSDVNTTESTSVLNDASKNIMYFDTGTDYVKSIRSSTDTVDTSVRYRQVSEEVSFTSGQAVITLTDASKSWFGSGSLSDSVKDANYQVVITGTSSTFLTDGEVVDMTSGSRDITVTGQQISFDLDDASFAGTCTIVTTIVDGELGERTKTANFCEQKTFTSPSSTNSFEVADVFNIVAVYDSGDVGTVPTLPTLTSSTDISASAIAGHSIKGQTSGATATVVSYSDPTLTIAAVSGTFQDEDITILDRDGATVTTATVSGFVVGDDEITGTLATGQKANFYDHSSVSVSATGQITVVYDYFSHSGSGYFSVDSYTGSGINYGEIPTFTNTSGVSIDLRDVLDFRPVRTAGSTDFTPNILPEPDNAITLDYQNYLGRIDAIWIDSSGSFGVTSSAPAETPVAPSLDTSQKIIIGYIEFLPYLVNVSDTEVTYVDNQRYTMKDIADIEKRVERLEEYVSLTMLETSASDYSVLDSSGLDRYKNGILVDPFEDWSVNDYFNSENKCSIDTTNNFATCSFYPRNTDLLYSSSLSSNVQKTGDLLTLPYTETAHVSQLKSSTVINVNSFDIINWSGVMTLSPPSDTWVDTETLPDVVVDGGTNVTYTGDTGTSWGNWNQTVSLVSDSTDITSLGSRVVNVEVIPYIRSRTISVSVVDLKPNTVMYPTFDGVDVAEYCGVNTSSLGGTLTTDSAGMLDFVFVIPNSDDLKFATGERVLQISSNPNSFGVQGSSYAQETYTASGILQQVENVYISTRTLVYDVSEEEDSGNDQGFGDEPTAQTFFVDSTLYPSGIFLSSLDLYFYSKDENIPVSVQIRPTVNGYPSSSQIMPLSHISKLPADVNISDDATAATNFAFPSPVYLEPGEYAIVILANSSEYSVYSAEMGEKDIESGETISAQPYTGSLFVSQASTTWTADQNSDLKFVLNRCVFDTAGGYVILENDDYEETVAVDVFESYVEEITPSNTSTTHTYKSTPYGGSLESDWSSMTNQASTYLTQRKELTNGVDGSFLTRVDMTSSSEHVSPVVDTGRMSLTVVQNLISNDDSDETTPTSGNAVAKYLTQIVTLEDGFDATDIRVLLDGYVASTSSIDVYYKVLSSADEDDFEDKNWVKMIQDGTVVSDTRSQVYELEYKSSNEVDSAITYTADGATFDNFDKFAIKVVMLASNPALAPTFTNLRVIALA